jgi:hypothetical protein
MFNILRNCQTVFQRSHTIYNPISNVWAYQLLAIIVGVKKCLIKVLICITPVNKSVDHCFICILEFCMFSLEKFLFRHFSHNKLGCFISLLLSHESSLYILRAGLYQTYSLDIFSLIPLIVFSLSSWYPLKHRSF